MRSCNPTGYLEFMRQAPEFERMLVRSGIRLFKFWFSVSREEQLSRFMSRAHDPLKQWKLSPMDAESLGRWNEYTKAKEDMLFYTDTADAPWTVVRSDDKKRARLKGDDIPTLQHPLRWQRQGTPRRSRPSHRRAPLKTFTNPTNRPVSLRRR
jgi:polyphosphate kinase 2 (PPK2 family)